MSDDDKISTSVYRPHNSGKYEAQSATASVKFCNRALIMDAWYLIGGTMWTRTLFRLRHPLIYSNRGLRNLYRRIKRIFVKDPPMILGRIWKHKEDLLEIYPEVKKEPKMIDELKPDVGNSAPVQPPKTMPKSKRDIFRFSGEKPTAINLEHVTQMSIEGKRITFQFYSTAMFIDMLDETVAASVFELLLSTWAGGFQEEK